jgi:ATP-dependent RNA helicase HelY
VLRDAEMQAGDFVRWTKQLIDLLGQIAVAAPDPDAEAEAAGRKSAVGRTARVAADLLRRGVVAYSSVA